MGTGLMDWGNFFAEQSGYADLYTSTIKFPATWGEVTISSTGDTRETQFIYLTEPDPDPRMPNIAPDISKLL